MKKSRPVKSPARYSIPGDLTIYTVTATKNALLAQPDTLPDPLELDLSQVAHIDTAGVQLLLMLKKILSEANKRLHLTHCQGDVRQTLQLLGLTTLLVEDL